MLFVFKLVVLFVVAVLGFAAGIFYWESQLPSHTCMHEQYGEKLIPLHEVHLPTCVELCLRDRYCHSDKGPVVGKKK